MNSKESQVSICRVGGWGCRETEKQFVEKSREA